MGWTARPRGGGRHLGDRERRLHLPAATGELGVLRRAEIGVVARALREVPDEVVVGDDVTLDGRSFEVVGIAPKGFDVRPTPDRVKQAVFNSLGGRVIGARVLHLIADGHFHDYVNLCTNPKSQMLLW